MKPVIWMGDSREVIQTFSTIARQEAGHQLYRVQCGNRPEDWKPFPGVGVGVYELRIHAEREYRVFYIAKFDEAIHVLHAFVKKSQRTPKRDIDLAVTRYRALLNERMEK